MVKTHRADRETTVISFDTNAGLLGLGLGLVAGGALGLPLTLLGPGPQASALVWSQTVKFFLYLGLGGTILIWRK